MREWSVDELARIGLLFLDGDAFETVLIDQEGHTDYRFAPFTDLKADLLRIEAIDPDLDVSAILWRAYPGNDRVAEPLIAGSGLPNSGWRRVFAPRPLREAFRTGTPQTHPQPPKGTSHYYPLRNSNDDIVGVLELLVGRGYRQDVGTVEMFAEPVPAARDDEG
ncbi:MAG TPA: hypothetical protein PKE04_08875 [Clostridia bacterium]|nr:hypothetical protein [Clostridia bacterium]